MIRKYVLPLVALAGFVFAILAAAEARRPVHSAPAVVSPAENPYQGGVSGAGIIEAESQNVAVAPAIGGIVVNVNVKWGEQVKEGQALYSIDPRPTRAQIAVVEGDVKGKEAALARAQADYQRLKASPREEDKPIFKAKLDGAKAVLSDVQDQFDRAKAVGTSAVSSDDYNRRYWAMMQAKTQTEAAQADYDKLIAGTWAPDLAVAKAAVDAAQADLDASKARLEPLQLDLGRLTVKSPIDGTVLRVNVRPGEYIAAAGTGLASESPLVIGDTEHLNVRVDIDENDVPRFTPGSPATGFVRGATKSPLKLTFVRVEPFVIPKRNLTGGNTERVDTRVLQAIYRIEKRDMPLYVGQQVDVFVEGAEGK